MSEFDLGYSMCANAQERTASIDLAQLDRNQVLELMLKYDLLTQIGYRALLDGDSMDADLNFLTRLVEIARRSLTSASPASRLTDEEIDIIWQTMPGGPGAWLKGFGYKNFAQAIEDEVILHYERAAGAGSAQHLSETSLQSLCSASGAESAQPRAEADERALIREAMYLLTNALPTLDRQYRSLALEARQFLNRAALARAPLPVQGCRWPTCESEKLQQEVAGQAYRELYSGERAQPVDDARDAERYRWLRARENNLDAVVDGDTMLFGESLDHAIDTEIAALRANDGAAEGGK